MTCIVAIRDGHGKVVMAGDARESTLYGLHNSRQSKVFELSAQTGVRDEWTPILVGVSGEARPCDLVRYKLLPPRRGPRSTEEYLVGEFIPALREVLQQGGAMLADPEHADMDLLVALDGRIFYMSENFGLTESDRDYSAIGNGAKYALGAIRLAEHYVKYLETPRYLAEAAIGVASEFTGSVGGQITVLEGTWTTVTMMG